MAGLQPTVFPSHPRTIIVPAATGRHQTTAEAASTSVRFVGPRGGILASSTAIVTIVIRTKSASFARIDTRSHTSHGWRRWYTRMLRNGGTSFFPCCRDAQAVLRTPMHMDDALYQVK